MPPAIASPPKPQKVLQVLNFSPPHLRPAPHQWNLIAQGQGQQEIWSEGGPLPVKDQRNVGAFRAGHIGFWKSAPFGVNGVLASLVAPKSGNSAETGQFLLPPKST
uniref:Uncharacterized protein n=1 Tax=Eutreptiella gymnastica TaxID=73025 RepID=A0A7S4FEN7_9EUGL|mmetsp:Transcript_19570/g.31314  ORF Transcript_19570/g.31314 Transcript_19570/m.31314 type:complete len:106 (+) Transcript_19570:174-491(+)